MQNSALNRRDFLKRAAAGVASLALGVGTQKRASAASARNPIIFFTKPLRDLSAEQIASAVKNLRCDGLDLAVRRGHCVSPENVRDALPRAMKIWKEAGLSVPMVSTETSLADPSDRSAEPIWAACAGVGIENVKVGYWAWKEGMSYWKMVDEARRDLEGFGKLSEKYGVRTLVHNHSGLYLACNASTLMTLLRDFDPARIGAYVDPAHLSINGEPLPLAFEIIGKHLAMVAVKNVAYAAATDASGTRWKSNWCLLREGLVDWTGAISLLKKRGYSSPLSLHAEYSDAGDREALLKKAAEDVKYLTALVK